MPLCQCELLLIKTFLSATPTHIPNLLQNLLEAVLNELEKFYNYHVKMACRKPRLVSVDTCLRYSAKALRQASKAATGLVIHERGTPTRKSGRHTVVGTTC